MGAFSSTVAAIQNTINLLGRSVTLRQHTGAVAIDGAKPWLGETQGASDFTDTTISMVFEPFRFDEMDDTIVKMGDVKAYVGGSSLGSIAPAPGDLLIDGSQSYRIMRVLHYNPSGDSIAWELHARQC